MQPTIVCLCGSTRFYDVFREANLRETLAGKIVLSVGCDMSSDEELFRGLSKAQLSAIKRNLDTLHMHKIYMADEILVLNIGGYVGESTTKEIRYAMAIGRLIRWLEPDKKPDWFPADYD